MANVAKANPGDKRWEIKGAVLREVWEAWIASLREVRARRQVHQDSSNNLVTPELFVCRNHL